MDSRQLIAVSLAAFFLSLPAHAGQWIADRDIGSYCQQYLTKPNSPSGAMCLSYIQGYLDGLRTTETPAFQLPIDNAEEATPEEAAAISAARLDALVEEFGPPARAGICLPENYSRDEIVRVIARAVRYGRSSGRSALDDYAQAALQQRYPCDTSDPGRQDDDGTTENVDNEHFENVDDERFENVGDEDIDREDSEGNVQ